jgi:flagellar basal body-associated protein FliL
MTKFIVVIAVAVTLAVVGVLAYTWVSLRDVAMSANGYIALVAGSVLTLAVGIGLIFLMYYSNREGFDDRPEVRTNNAEDEQQRPPGNA